MPHEELPHEELPEVLSIMPGQNEMIENETGQGEDLLEQLRALRPKLIEEERLRTTAELALRAERDALEAQVARRTQELSEAVRKLEAQTKELEAQTNALSIAERRLRVLVRATAQIVWIADAAGNVLEAEGWTEFTGQSLAEMRAGRYSEVLHPDEAEDVLAAWNASVAYGSPYVIEHRLRRRDGVYETFSVRGIPLLDERGVIVEWIGMTTNLSFRAARPPDSVTIGGKEIAGVIVPGLTPRTGTAVGITTSEPAGVPNEPAGVPSGQSSAPSGPSTTDRGML